MSRDLTAESGLSYDLVLEAVQESRRGRWFLEEFKARNCREDSKQILSAIARLESAVGASPTGNGPAAELVRIRQAIAATRQEILQDWGSPALSSEGRLFAHLADLARKCTIQASEPASNANIPRGIVQALRLVDQIDGDLNQVPPSGEEYFKRDKDIFVAQSGPARATSKPSGTIEPVSDKHASLEKAPETKSAVEAPALGARIVISHTKKHIPAQATNSIAENSKQIPSTLDTVQITAGTTDTESAGSHPRIVIIRRKPEDMPPAPGPEAKSLTENAA